MRSLFLFTIIINISVNCLSDDFFGILVTRNLIDRRLFSLKLLIYLEEMLHLFIGRYSFGINVVPDVLCLFLFDSHNLVDSVFVSAAFKFGVNKKVDKL